ncbi:hypothetical protein LIER_20688 [Lithospermum erythrorhizon]|uniref:Uncharacterized protein n=1 Tax=Lithospermum erythrorhizon TaxID=34254 RepID=A0AAV3QNF9_LITER
MGRQSLISQEVFMWDGVLRSKWEVFEHLANVEDEVWRFNNCLPPKRWVPPTLLANIDEATEPGEAGSSSFSGSSDRAMSMLESINANMLKLVTDNESIKVDMRQLRLQQERMIMEQERMNVEQERMRVEQERMQIQFENMFPLIDYRRHEGMNIMLCFQIMYFVL